MQIERYAASILPPIPPEVLRVQVLDVQHLTGQSPAMSPSSLISCTGSFGSLATRPPPALAMATCQSSAIQQFLCRYFPRRSSAVQIVISRTRHGFIPPGRPSAEPLPHVPLGIFPHALGHTSNQLHAANNSEGPLPTYRSPTPASAIKSAVDSFISLYVNISGKVSWELSTRPSLRHSVIARAICELRGLEPLLGRRYL
jgi:hypothetical protein